MSGVIEGPVLPGLVVQTNYVEFVHLPGEGGGLWLVVLALMVGLVGLGFLLGRRLGVAVLLLGFCCSVEAAYQGWTIRVWNMGGSGPWNVKRVVDTPEEVTWPSMGASGASYGNYLQMNDADMTPIYSGPVSNRTGLYLFGGIRSPGPAEILNFFDYGYADEGPLPGETNFVKHLVHVFNTETNTVSAVVRNSDGSTNKSFSLGPFGQGDYWVTNSRPTSLTMDVYDAGTGTLLWSGVGPSAGSSGWVPIWFNDGVFTPGVFLEGDETGPVPPSIGTNTWIGLGATNTDTTLQAQTAVLNATLRQILDEVRRQNAMGTNAYSSDSRLIAWLGTNTMSGGSSGNYSNLLATLTNQMERSWTNASGLSNSVYSSLSVGVTNWIGNSVVGTYVGALSNAGWRTGSNAFGGIAGELGGQSMLSASNVSGFQVPGGYDAEFWTVSVPMGFGGGGFTYTNVSLNPYENASIASLMDALRIVLLWGVYVWGFWHCWNTIGRLWETLVGPSGNGGAVQSVAPYLGSAVVGVLMIAKGIRLATMAIVLTVVGLMVWLMVGYLESYRAGESYSLITGLLAGPFRGREGWGESIVQGIMLLDKMVPVAALCTVVVFAYGFDVVCTVICWLYKSAFVLVRSCVVGGCVIGIQVSDAAVVSVHDASGVSGGICLASTPTTNVLVETAFWCGGGDWSVVVPDGELYLVSRGTNVGSWDSGGAASLLVGLTGRVDLTVYSMEGGDEPFACVVTESQDVGWWMGYEGTVNWFWSGVAVGGAMMAMRAFLAWYRSVGGSGEI